MKSTAFWLLYGVPELALMMYCGTRLLGLRPPAKQFWLAALGVSALAVFIRGLPIPFGLGTVLVFLVYSFVAVKAFRLSWRTAMLAAAIGFFLLTMGEALVVVPVLTAKRMTVDQAMATLPGRLLIGYLSLGILILVSLLVLFFRIRLFTVPEADRGAVAGQQGAQN